jgi:hypothetical protein
MNGVLSTSGNRRSSFSKVFSYGLKEVDLFPTTNDFPLRKQQWLQSEAYDTPSFSRSNQPKDD